MTEFRQYLRISVAEMRPYVEGEILDENVSVSSEDVYNGSPRVGDMIARNPNNHRDMWLVAEKYFQENFTPNDPTPPEPWNENLGSLLDDPRKPLLLSLEESGWICHRLMQDLASPVKPSNSVFAEAMESVRQRMLHLYGRVSALNDDLMGKKND